MKIKKLGHCCMVIDIGGTRILTDPGAPDYSGVTKDEKDISLVLITHEHSDHLHVDSLKKILENNPNATVITNSSVGKILDGENIKYTKVEDGEEYEFNGIQIKGFGELHAKIYEDFGQVQNTGYMIDSMCYPADSFNIPEKFIMSGGKVDILALPVAGPWMKISDAIDYAKKLNPRIVIPVHDGMIKEFAAFLYTIPKYFLEKVNIEFKKLEIGKEEEI